MKLEFSRQIIEKFSHNLFYENPSSGTRVVPCGQTDRQTDMTKLKIAFRNFSKGAKILDHPSKYCILSFDITTDTAVQSHATSL